MDKYCNREKIHFSFKPEYYLLTWAVPKVSSIDKLEVKTDTFKMQNGFTYVANLSLSEEKIGFTIVTSTSNLKCFVSMYIGSEILISKTLSEPTRSLSSPPYHKYFDLVTVSSQDKCFQKLRQYPNDTLVLLCRIKYPANTPGLSSVKTSNTSMDTLFNLQQLASVLKNSPEPLLNEKVILQVGEETEKVSKAVLCARSPVFAKMFKNNMEELKDNIVIITDIQMPVLKVLVTFLYSGRIFKSNFDFLCELYYASDKYDIADLRQACTGLLLSKISMENIVQVLKFAISNNDVQVKYAAMTMIAANIESWVLTNDWKNLINDEPKIAVEVLNYFDF